ncbi:MAG: hypothetical protein GY810_08040 [Aureispira sp.]|nr:hypothetical protein [Aureispira sp.]
MHHNNGRQQPIEINNIQFKMKIKGTVKHQKLSGGFWGIVGDEGDNWRPVKMPEDLKVEGLKVEISAEREEGGISIFMWGTPIRIIEFKKV